MQSAKNRMKVLSALSMAAAATFAVKSANAASLSLYYGQSSSTAAAKADSVYVGTGIATSSPGNLTGGTAQTVSQTAATTITVPVGQYLSISINALLTGDTNPDGGSHTSHPSYDGSLNQPATLGLSALGIRIPVSANDANGSILQPVNNGASYTTFNSVAGYNSYATLNQNTTTPGGPETPQWLGSHSVGDVEQQTGSVGANNQIFGGNSGQQLTFTAGGMNMLQQFSAASAAYGSSTEFFRGLVYQGLSAGVVTLSPFADTTATQYWSVLTPAAQNGGTTDYQPSYFGTSDHVGTLPVLVIDVVGGSTHQAVVSLTSAAPTSYGTSSGTLTVAGSNGKYTLNQITGLTDVTNYVEAAGWNPATDEEVYGLDVLVNGNAANAAQLATLVNAIGGDGLATASSGVTASATDPLGAAAFPSQYNLFLSYAGGGPSSPDFLGVDLSSGNDSNLAGYSFSAVAAVPEPMTIGLMAVGAVGLMARRNRRKA